MKQVSALSMYELTKYVRSVAQEAGLSVQYSNKGYSYLKGKTIFLAPEKAPINPQRAMYQLRKIIHEAAHFTDSDMQVWEDNPLTQESPLRSIWNMIEDHRIEHVQSQRYDGDADIIDAGTSVAMEQAFKVAEELPPQPDPKKQQEIDMLVAMLKWDRENRCDWMPSANSIDLKLTPEQQRLFTKMQKYSPDLRKVRAVEGKAGTALAYELAKQVYEELGGDSKEEEEKGRKAQAAGKAAGHGDDKDGAPKSGKGGKEDETRKGLSLSPSNDGENIMDGEPSGCPGSRGTGVAIPAMPQEFYVHNFANPAKSQIGGRDLVGERGYTRSAYSGEIASVRANGSTSEQLAQQMRKLVQIKTRSRVQYGLKEGKLHGASLHRIVSNVPGYSERVFKKKQDHLDIDSAVAVCIDMSGSMHGDKISHACAAAEMLSETVGNALGVPLMMYGFSECLNIAGGPDPSPSILVLRDFNERMVPTERLRERAVQAIGATMGNNPDGDAVVWGYHQLRAARGKRKILFVLSDGQPASGRRGNQGHYLKHITQTIEKSPIKLFGLGLMDNSVRSFYTNHAVVNSATDIEPKIIQLVDNFILHRS